MHGKAAQVGSLFRFLIVILFSHSLPQPQQRKLTIHR